MSQASSHYLSQIWRRSLSPHGVTRPQWGKDDKRGILILYHILDFIQQKKNKFTIELPFMLPILCCQYHGWWCLGDLRSQGISRHGIDLQSLNIPSQAWEELSFCLLTPWWCDSVRTKIFRLILTVNISGYSSDIAYRAPFTYMDQLQSQHEWIITCPVKCVMKLLIYPKLHWLKFWSLGMDK